MKRSYIISFFLLILLGWLLPSPLCAQPERLQRLHGQVLDLRFAALQRYAEVSDDVLQLIDQNPRALFHDWVLQKIGHETANMAALTETEKLQALRDLSQQTLTTAGRGWLLDEMSDFVMHHPSSLPQYTGFLAALVQTDPYYESWLKNARQWQQTGEINPYHYKNDDPVRQRWMNQEALKKRATIELMLQNDLNDPAGILNILEFVRRYQATLIDNDMQDLLIFKHILYALEREVAYSGNTNVLTGAVLIAKQILQQDAYCGACRREMIRFGGEGPEAEKRLADLDGAILDRTRELLFLVTELNHGKAFHAAREVLNSELTQDRLSDHHIDKMHPLNIKALRVAGRPHQAATDNAVSAGQNPAPSTGQLAREELQGTPPITTAGIYFTATQRFSVSKTDAEQFMQAAQKKAGQLNNVESSRIIERMEVPAFDAKGTTESEYAAIGLMQLLGDNIEKSGISKRVDRMLRELRMKRERLRQTKVH